MTCLKMAAKDGGVRSIAFPTLGCGRLGYGPTAVADCFLRAVSDSAISLEVKSVLTALRWLDSLKYDLANLVVQPFLRKLTSN